MLNVLSHPRTLALSSFATGLAVLTLGACSSSPTTSGTSAPPSPQTSATTSAPAWGYDTGLTPAQWGSAYPDCADAADSTQSPIDIDVAALGATDATDPVQLDLTATYWSVFNNGHTVEAAPVTKNGEEAAGSAGSFTIGGTKYVVAQFHLHSPSEHTFNGQATDIEMHVVGKTADGAKIAVIGLLLRVGTADQVPALDAVFAAAPSKVTDEKDGVVLTSQLNLADVLPTGAQVARYDGSLTTPPCTEGVLWDVYTAPLTVATEQASAFTALYSNNARPVQPLHGRTATARTVVAG